MKIASNNSKNLENIFQTLKNVFRDFPGSPVVKTSPSTARSVSLISGQGTKIPHASWPKNQNIKQKQYCNKFNEDFKNGPRQKKKKSFKKCGQYKCVTPSYTRYCARYGCKNKEKCTLALGFPGALVWLRIHLPMQDKWVQSLGQEDPLA